ncbi:SIR2 family protein [Chryseobacterium gallinarum]|uniref:SIR2 family NAD-dependent protein deacylase n=1 Tax=Chryseobacterium gallinarum TaxID=1324352 RepID=UPI0020257445|nr:SIR2 family protein [Chryseobacterium gallinarum]MCL8537999.1 SIR2 family protein [Chryseobacterium gallinarum]
MIDNLPSDIQSYFDEIAERLWTGHASIMVGAGFSKNAINTIDPAKQPPNWWELGDIFYEKLYSRKPSNDVKYASLLKLAEEFEVTFGRSVLENIIAKNIADNEYEPSDLHKKLIELPWTDVFTTNYDTLLERSSKDVTSRRYNVVINKNDLSHSSKPRIIKLHGSLPSEKPFIITEEDYRNYPKKFAPFVNTVQQSLLENTLCLLGFSGDDPNFLQWIGWINDNIGKNNASKIYLVGVLNLSESQKRLLNSKNIITVNLSNTKIVNGDHKKGIELFIEYLASKKFKRDNLNWPLSTDLKTYKSLSEEVDFKPLIQEWRNCREKYPNWLILPQEQRERLWRFTEIHSTSTYVFKNLGELEDLEYIYELNWRLEKCLFPIYNDMASYFQKILDKYNLFPENIRENREFNILEKSINKNEADKYKDHWKQLSLSLLRFYREENFEKEWSKTCNILDSIKGELSSDQLSCFYYEQIQKALFKLNVNEAKKILNEWSQNNIPIFWNVKRAMILSEFNQIKEALTLLNKNLLEIKQKLYSSLRDDDYTWVSLESYTMFLINILQGNIQFEKDKINLKINSDDYKDRWNDILQYKCDPWGEQKYFDLILQKPYFQKDKNSDNNNFEIGKVTRSFTLGSSSKDFITAYNFLRFIEELAIPLSLSQLNLSDKTINGALERIKFVSPQWGIAIANRCRDEKIVDTVFDRIQMIKLSSSLIDSYSQDYITKFYELLPEQSSPIAKVFIRKVPNLLSRLCTKCSDSLKLEIYKLCNDLYTRELNIPKTNKLLDNLINSSNYNVLNKAMVILLEFPILNSEWAISYTLQEPFDLIREPQKQIKIKIKKGIFDLLIEKIKGEKGFRINAIKRLIYLYNCKQLTTPQSQKLFNAIWSQTDEAWGFPKNTNYYHFAFINWPHPEDINVEEMYKKYINENNFNVQNLKADKGIGMSRGSDRYFEELYYGSKTINNDNGVIWNINELENILVKCETWWKLDKSYLQDEKYKDEGFGGSIYEEFVSRFNKLPDIISRVLGFYKDTLNNNIVHRIKTISEELESNNIPVLRIKVVFNFYNHYENYLSDLKKGLRSNNRRILLDALNSVILAVHCSSYANDTIFINRLIDILSIPLQWKMLDLLGDIFDVFEDFINHSKIVSDSVKQELYDSLQYVLHLSIDDKISIDDFLLLKQKSIKLASSIYKKNLEYNLSVPQIVYDWKAISQSNEEFSDIRNRW